MSYLWNHLKLVSSHNVKTLRHAPLAELSGALGDLGTLLPLMIAMAVSGAIDLPSSLVFSGLTNVVTGALFGIPLPVQPMKAIASVAISQHMSRDETTAAGLTMGFAVLFLSVTGLLRLLHHVVPISVVKGIQVGAGLALIVNAGATLLQPLTWTTPTVDNRICAVVAFILLVVAASFRKLPYALVVTVIGFVIAGMQLRHDSGQTRPSLWRPEFSFPSASSWRVGAINAAIPQLPLTTLNSILAVTSLAETLFPTSPPIPSTTSIGLSVAFSNLIACWFGGMPMCHGSGGLAGQYFFGARSGTSIIFLGMIKLLLGLFVGTSIIPYLAAFPKSLLGIMVVAAGLELTKVSQTVRADLWERAQGEEQVQDTQHTKQKDYETENTHRATVMLVTAAGCLACKNDAVGFIAGMVWHYSSRLIALIKRKRAEGNIRLPANEA